MKIEQLFEHKKGVKAVKYTSKPRDPNTKTMQGIRSSGAAGAHTDKKKAAKQGVVKHKGKELAENNELEINPGTMSAVEGSSEPTVASLDAVFNEQDFYRLEHVWDALEAGDKEEALRQINHYLRKGKNRAWWGDLQAVDIKIDPNDVENSMVMWSKPIEVSKLDEDWQKVNKSDKTDGMSSKAVKAYRRENPGSKLKTAVTTKPSKLKKGSKSAKRRKSFCARMSGMKKAHASAKTKRDPDSPINKALRRWNCESVEDMRMLIEHAERVITEEKKGLYYYVNKRKKAGTSRSKNHPDAPSAQDWKNAAKTAKNEDSLNEIKKGQKDSNGFTKCWPGKHAEGTKKGKNGGQVRNCVPNESKIYEQEGTFSSSNMQMSIDGARLRASTDLLRKKYGDNFQDKPGPGIHYDQEVQTIADPKNPGKYQSTVRLRPKEYKLSPKISARASIAPDQDFDYYYDGQQMMPDHPLYDRVKQTHLDSMRAPVEPDASNENYNYDPNDDTKKGLAESIISEMSRNPDLMSTGDYDRYQQSQMDNEKRSFKRQELEHELGHEDRGMYYVVIAKNGKWEYTKAQPRQEGMNAAQRVIDALHAKYPNMHLGMMGPDGKVYNMGKGK